MSNQRLLFESPEALQMMKILGQLSDRNRQRIITILAEMGKAALTMDPTNGEGTSDEL